MEANQLIEPEWLFPCEYMSVGESFFIPTLRLAEMMYIIDTSAKRAKIRVKSYVSVKDDHIGIRTWRVS
jgi:hypothetical protein